MADLASEGGDEEVAGCLEDDDDEEEDDNGGDQAGAGSKRKRATQGSKVRRALLRGRGGTGELRGWLRGLAG